MGSPQLLGLGIRASITGKHSYYVITDDICNKDDRESRAERERTKRQYDELQNIRNRGGKIINLGTPWHKDDVFSKMPNIERWDCYHTGILTKEKIEELRQSMAPSLFAANYELKHIASTELIFETAPRFTDDLSLIRDGVSHVDAAYGLQILSAEDDMETHSYSFGGLSEIYEQFMMDMAGAAEIPATKLFGRSPQGMNSTGEMDLRNYYDMIAQLQERMLRPALEKLLPIMAISCWGFVPENLEIIFEPVMTTSAAERAELVQKLSSDVIEAFKCGLINQRQALEELKARGEELGVYTKV